MPSKLRVLLAAVALLVSVPSAYAENAATFSPELKDATAASPPTAIAEAPPATRGAKATKRRTRLAKIRTPRAVADATSTLAAAAVKSLTIGGISAPLPPVHDNADAANAVAMLEVPAARGAAGGSKTEPASATPEPSAAQDTRGPRERAAETVAALLARHAMENGVPLRLAEAVVRIESRGNAHASNHGALGLMQIKYGTARAVGFDGPAIALFVADTNLRYGMKVLAQAWRAAGGDLCGALMRYQSGQFATHMNSANRAYCSRARAIMAGA